MSAFMASALIGATAVTAGLDVSAFAGSRPHLVMVLQDDLGHHDVGFTGNPEAKSLTGNISTLAEQGIVLERHYVHWHCSPTRRSFLSGRLPVHHHEQLSGDQGDDIDLRWTWISDKLKLKGYACHWFGKGHTGYRSMAHLPTRHGFDSFLGFLGGSQSYFSNVRWQNEHPLTDDNQFVNPPPICAPGQAELASESIYHANAGGPLPYCNTISLVHNITWRSVLPTNMAVVASEDECCLMCQNTSNPPAHTGCSHWLYRPALSGGGNCSIYDSGGKYKAGGYDTLGVMFHNSGPPKPPPGPPPTHDTKCHAQTYSTTLYGEACLQAIKAHDSTTPLFLYFPIQAVHTPYMAAPGYPASSGGTVYQSMLWDSDVYIGGIVNLLRAKDMWSNTLLVYSADNGGTGSGLNFPLRGEKHTNWDGGMRVAAFVSGGLIPLQLRGTSSNINCHIVDWHPTFSFLAGAPIGDDPPVPPLPVDATRPNRDIYGNHSYPGLDGVNLWPYLMNPATANLSSAHPVLVLSKEVVIMGRYKLLVAQNAGWNHSSDNGWKIPGSAGGWNGSKWTTPNSTMPCMAADLSGPQSQLSGIPGKLPCLFDLEIDPNERIDIGSQPQNRDRVLEMWSALNQTVLGAYCRNVGKCKDCRNSCDRSPQNMLGHCDKDCSHKYWNGSSGPICGVPGC